MPEETSIRSALTIPARRVRDIDGYGRPPQAPAHHQRSVGLIIWQRKALVLACVLAALVGGVIYLSRATPLYSSSSKLYVQQSVSKIVSEDLGGGTAAAVNMATQCELIKSTAILKDALTQPGMSDLPAVERWENPVGMLKGMVTAEPVKQGDMLVVSVTTSDPNVNAAIVNGVVQAYIGYQTNQHQSSAVRVAAILRAEADSNQRDLKEAQKRMLALRQENPELMAQFDRRDQSVSLKAALARQLSEVVFRQNNLHAAVRSAEAARGDLTRLRQLIELYALGTLLPPSQAARVSAEYDQEAGQLNQMSDHHLGTANDVVLTAQAQLERTRAQLDAAVRQDAANCLDTIRVASAAADEEADQLHAAFDAEEKAALALNAKAAEYDQLAATAQRAERTLEGLDGRLKDIDFTKDVGPMSISVLESAKPDRTVVSPIRSTVLGKCLVAGLIAGLGLAMVADRFDQRLRSIEEIPGLLGTPILGVIPRTVRRDMRASVGRETFLMPRSAVAEAFRTVRTAIYFGAHAIDEGSVKTIMVTSPTPGDGKSTCVSNLAIAVAQAGRRVLLIDADCRRPVQHKTFDVPGTAGLTGVLTRKCTLTAAIRPTGVERLDLLCCGPLPHNPAELLDSQVMLDVLAEAARRYDQVLIDSPPVNLVSDGRILAASCDATVMVLRAERSTRRGATMAWNLLGSVGANRLGVVVNDVTRNMDGYYGYNYYGRYGYGPSHSADAGLPNGEAAAADTNGHAGPVTSPRALEAAARSDGTPEI